MHARTSGARFLACLLLVLCIPLSAQSAESVQQRLAQQNALFDEYYETDLRMHPETATRYGDYRYNDRLNDYSLAAIDRQNRSDRDFLARLRTISVAGFSEQDKLSHEVLESVLDQHLANYRFKEYEMPVNQMGGPQRRPAARLIGRAHG